MNVFVEFYYFTWNDNRQESNTASVIFVNKFCRMRNFSKTAGGSDGEKNGWTPNPGIAFYSRRAPIISSGRVTSLMRTP